MLCVNFMIILNNKMLYLPIKQINKLTSKLKIQTILKCCKNKKKMCKYSNPWHHYIIHNTQSVHQSWWHTPSRKVFRSTSASRKAIGDTSSAQKRSPIPVLM